MPSTSISSIRYLPEDAKVRLEKYEYHGEDRSYIYKHMWRPLCRRVVELLPVWLAPNVITVLALVFVCVTHAILAYYMPKLTVKDYSVRSGMAYAEGFPATATTLPEGTTTLPFAKEFLPPPPPFVFVLAAAALFIYQLLDNLDGHQARRTGTSSPLGLLLDHGCDAFNCIVGSLSVAAALSTGPCWKAWLIVMNTVILFFLNTWEEYYRGVLVLPVINGPNEGILTGIAIYLWTAYVGGPQWWYNNAVEVPTRWLPSLLRQPAPAGAVATERYILDRVCAVIRYVGGDVEHEFAALPFFLNLNCTTAYREHPPLPTRLQFSPEAASYEQLVVGKQWIGHGIIQKSVLRLYGFSEESLRVKYNTIAVLIMTLLSSLTCLGNVYQVYRALRRKTREGQITKFGHRSWLLAHFPFTHALTRTVPLFVLTCMANAWFLTSREDIFRRHPRIFLWTVGLIYTKLCIHLMVAHLCNTEFNPFRRTFLPFMLFGAHIVTTYVRNIHRTRKQHAPLREPAPAYVGEDGQFYLGLEWASNAYSYYAYDLDEELILYEFFALSVITFTHLVFNLVRETAAALQVPIFRIPKAKQKALKDKIHKARKSAAMAPPSSTSRKH